MAGCPHAATQGGATALQILEVFDTFRLETRSAVLDGSIPLRAAQGCKPFLDGNSAGLHLSVRRPARIDRENDSAILRLTDEGLAEATKEYGARLDQLVRGGYLAAGGHWERELRKGFAVQEGDLLRIWTGMLARPDVETWWLVSTAFNRWSLAHVKEYVISDAEGWVPLMVEIDIPLLRRGETWLDTEVATLTPLKPGARLEIEPIGKRPEAGRTLLGFFTPDHMERRMEVKSTGAYRRLSLPVRDAEGDDRTSCFVYAGGRQDVVSRGRFERFATAEGFAPRDPVGRELEFAVYHAAFDVTGSWDGSNFRDFPEPADEEMERIAGEWEGLYGEGSFEPVRFWASYVLSNLGPHRGEPFLTIMPWLLAQSPAGWSVILEGMSFPNLDGLRGVIATDVFPNTAPEFQVYAPGEFRIPGGAAMARAIPVPRRVLTSTHVLRIDASGGLRA
jgi:hypothetical protein